jgi:hypothetical protein
MITKINVNIFLHLFDNMQITVKQIIPVSRLARAILSLYFPN